jgi:TIR domain
MAAAPSTGQSDASELTPRLAFISHHHDDLGLAERVSVPLRTFGFSGFIAHRDLDSGSEWLEEIKRKLREAAVLIAIVTPSFASSDWTDQEVGFAIGRDVPVVPIKGGQTPYGFMGHIQGVPWKDTSTGGSRPDGTWSEAEQVEQIAELGRALLRRQALDKRQLVRLLERSGSWHSTRVLLATLGDLNGLPDSEVVRIAHAAATNIDVYDCNQAAAAIPPLLQSRRPLLDPQLVELLRKRSMLPPEG